MGVVYYANYLHLFERGRNELIRFVGLFSYADVEARGVFLPVREAQCAIWLRRVMMIYSRCTRS